MRIIRGGVMNRPRFLILCPSMYDVSWLKGVYRITKANPKLANFTCINFYHHESNSMRNER